MLPHQLSNFERQRLYQNKPKLKVVYLRYSLPKIKDEQIQ